MSEIIPRVPPPSLPPYPRTVILTDLRLTISHQKLNQKNVFYFNEYKMVRYDDIRVKIQAGT